MKAYVFAGQSEYLENMKCYFSFYCHVFLPFPIFLPLKIENFGGRKFPIFYFLVHGLKFRCG